ncbi:MAG: hypothetical protein IJX35_00790 [Candidatus Methanomethylophilaceae archaeon]|uniref:RNA-binding domain-containing protein n=1 Tax=Candidatus Methanarcanum hacksteinii TaxID=2911857 RepID=UPI002A7BE8ED|nr:hypothetical protein [Candidatus Methanomethylophilaceae archaeon]
MTSVRISCPVNPSEDEEKVRSAILSIFPDSDLVLNDGRLEGEATLDRFAKIIRKQKILDATRAVLIMNSRGNTTRMTLNKQVATVGKVSFADKRPVLGGIEVTIEDENLMALIDKVSPITVDGEEVIQ